MSNALADTAMPAAQGKRRRLFGSRRTGATMSRGTIASQYIAPMVGYPKAPLARGTPRASNSPSRKSRHSVALLGTSQSTNAVTPDNRAPPTSANRTRRPTSGGRARARTAKKRRTPLKLRRANLSAAARYEGAARAETKSTPIHTVAARTSRSSRRADDSARAEKPPRNAPQASPNPHAAKVAYSASSTLVTRSGPALNKGASKGKTKASRRSSPRASHSPVDGASAGSLDFTPAIMHKSSSVEASGEKRTAARERTKPGLQFCFDA